MFNKKLKLENEELKKEIEKQKSTIKRLRQDLELPLPKDCEKGDYCKACGFSKKVYYNDYSSYSFCNNYYYVCAKDCCKEFVRKEEN